MSDSVRPHRRQPTRLSRPWDSPGKNTGVGSHFLLQCRKVKSESEVAQSSPTLRDPVDCSLPGSSTHGIFQARVLEWGAIAFSEVLTVVRKQIQQERRRRLKIGHYGEWWSHPGPPSASVSESADRNPASQKTTEVKNEFLIFCN